MRNKMNIALLDRIMPNSNCLCKHTKAVLNNYKITIRK